MDTESDTAVRKGMTSTVRLFIWTAVWVGTLALASFGPALWGSAPLLTWGVVVLNLATGVGWIIAHAGFLRTQDDLQRKILLDGIAIALGAGLVFGFAYSVVERAGLFVVESEIAILSVFMAIVYMVSIAVGYVRYR
jgi:hypothetical protein